MFFYETIINTFTLLSSNAVCIKSSKWCYLTDGRIRMQMAPFYFPSCTGNTPGSR